MKIKFTAFALMLPLVFGLFGCQSIPLAETSRTTFNAPPLGPSGQVRIGAFHIPKDEPGIKLTQFLLGGPNLNKPFDASIFDVTEDIRYLGTLTVSWPFWLDFTSPAGKRTLMLTAGPSSQKIDWQNVDFIEVDVRPSGISHVVISRYGFLSYPYFGEVQISDPNRKYCESLTGNPRAREKATRTHMAANGIDPNATDFVRFCRALSDHKRIVNPTDEARRQFTELKPQLEKLRVEHYEKWKREAEKRTPYDLMRSYQPIEALWP